MKHLLILILVITHAFAFANKKFIIETDKSIPELILIDKKSGVEKILIAQQADNTNFVFEANELEGLFLKTELSIFARIYSVSDKRASDWYPLKNKEIIPLISFFENHVSANIELKEFYIKTFQTNPLTDSKSKLRNLVDNFFYNSDFVNFIIPQNLNISWVNGYDILELNIFDKTENKIIYSTTNYSDTILCFENIDSKLQKLLKESSSYVLMVYSADSLGNTSVFKINFQFSPFYFKDNNQTTYFMTHSDINFSWFANKQSVDILIYDDENHLVYKKLKFSESSFDSKLFEDKINIFTKRKRYSLCIQLGQNTIFKEFYILLDSYFDNFHAN